MRESSSKAKGVVLPSTAGDDKTVTWDKCYGCAFLLHLKFDEVFLWKHLCLVSCLKCHSSFRAQAMDFARTVLPVMPARNESIVHQVLVSKCSEHNERSCTKLRERCAMNNCGGARRKSLQSLLRVTIFVSCEGGQTDNGLLNG